MFNHVGIKVANFQKALAFYRAALAPLGYEAQSVDADAKSAGFGPKGNPGLWIGEGKATKALHLAFESVDRASVERFYDAALAAGGKDNGAPGPRPDYGPSYYAAFVIDPDGNNIEAVTTKPAAKG